MKLKSIIKATLSGFIWGLGQLLNKQFFKAFFFFIFFIVFITIEVSTSNYGKEVDPYERISGNDFETIFFEDYYYYNKAKGSDEELESYYNEVTNYGDNLDNFNEEAVIKYLAEELKENSKSTFKNLVNNDVVLKEDFNEDFHPLESNYYIFYNEGKYYKEISTVGDKYILEINPVTGKTINEESIYNYKDFDIYYRGNSVARDANNEFYLILNKENTSGEEVYLDILDKSIYTELDTDPRKLNINYQLAVSADYSIVYEYYQPGIAIGANYIQYIGGVRTDNFKAFVSNQYNQTVSNIYTASDYNKFMFKVALELDPILKEEFEQRYNNFFYDEAGLFIKSFWSVATLGEIGNFSYKQHMAVVQALLPSNVSLNTSYEILGHVSVQVLLEGIIGIILFAFFMIPLVWSVTDAYKVSNQKINDKEVESEKTYFKSVYENCFEYIVLSPALFVLAFISIMPIIFGFILAFTSISGAQSMISNFEFVGFRNFINLFNFADGLGSSFGTMFWKVLLWTILWAILSTVTVFFGGLFQALILNSDHIVFRKFWRCILILPWAIPGLFSQKSNLYHS